MRITNFFINPEHPEQVPDTADFPESPVLSGSNDSVVLLGC
jgi:hypothetical protein